VSTGSGDRTAALDPLEPELRVLLKAADRLGHISAQIEITADHLMQAHKMEFEIDQSFLPSIIRQCSEVVSKYPIRGVSS
jgi:hypothetical protein